MRGLVGIDTCMLDDDLARVLRGYGIGNFSLHITPEYCAFEISIQVSSAGNFNFGNSFDGAEPGYDLLRNLPWRSLQSLRQFKTHRRSYLAHLDFRRAFCDDGYVQTIFLTDVCAQCATKLLGQAQIHGS